MDFIRLPELYLSLHGLCKETVSASTSAKRLDLRGTDQKKDRERHQAAYLARAWMGALQIDNMYVGFPPEYSDHDVVLRWTKNGKMEEMKVQLKEQPPKTLVGPEITIEEIIAGAVKNMAPSPDVVLAVFCNRTGGGKNLFIPPHKYGGLLAFGVMGFDPIRVFVTGAIGILNVDATVPMAF